MNLNFKYYPTASVVTVDINEKRYYYDISDDKVYVGDTSGTYNFFKDKHYIVSPLYVKLHHLRLVTVIEQDMRFE